MRWAYEGVDFEPGGLDHSTPGSSYTVGKELVKRVFDFRAPSYVAYAFVGFAGVQKMSSSAGGVPTAADALKILEAPILRWLYVRRAPKQAFNIDFGAEVVRLYDEWDALGRKAAAGEKRDAQVLAFERAVSTAAAGRLPSPARVESFRQLSSVADITNGDETQISRIFDAPVADLEPRLTRAWTWMRDYGDRTTVRDEPDTERLAALTEDEELWLRQLLDRLPDQLELDGTTALVYGVPKLARGLGIDDAPTDQVKQDQKDFFRLLYNLLVDADRGPRLPTLFLALGADKVRSLLTPA
jgi:lysyl-tRNA synthetase class 1